MKEAVIIMYEQEVHRTRLAINHPTLFNRSECVWNAIQRCLGIAEFAQTCPSPLSFEEIEPLYEKVKAELESLLEGI